MKVSLTSAAEQRHDLINGEGSKSPPLVSQLVFAFATNDAYGMERFGFSFGFGCGASASGGDVWLDLGLVAMSVPIWR